MHIGILGGSFNPPHLGHVLVAQQILDFTDIEKIWLLPAYNHTFGKTLLDIKHRLAMTKMLVGKQIEISTLEIDHKLDGNTINLVPILEKQYPEIKFTFIIGSDQLPTFHKWGSWQELLQKLPFLVFLRAGYPAKPLYKGMQDIDNPLLITTNISSSLVRERLKKGFSINHLVPPLVEAYINKHGLYH